MARPKASKNDTQITVCLPKDMLYWLEEVSRLKGRPVNKEIVLALKDHVLMAREVLRIS